MTPLATICDPYLNLFRGIIPPLGGTIDLSPILAFVVLDVRLLCPYHDDNDNDTVMILVLLQLFTNSAAALPAEMYMVEGSQEKKTTKVSRRSHVKAWWAKVMSHREC